MSAITESKSRKKQLNFGNLQFPKQDMAHFCTLIFTEYQRKAIPDLRAKKPVKIQNIPTNAIVLPIPANLQEVFQANYQGAELGDVGAAASIYNEFQSGKSMGDSGLNLSDIGKKVASAALGGSDSNIVKAGQKYFGEVFNPHLTTLFQGVSIRNHQFTWRLSPTSKEESMALKNIIDTIRYKMLPPRKNSLILGYPAEVEVQFHGDGYGIYPIYRCVVTGLTVNHAAAGTPVFFADTGMPAEIEISISLQETEVVLREDVNAPQDGSARGVVDTSHLPANSL
jgi:hypothetical protein